MTDHAHSPPTGRVGRYDGSCLLQSYRPCRPLCRTRLPPNLTPTERADSYARSSHSLPCGRADRCADNPHSNPTGHTDSYAGPSSLYSNQPWSPLCWTILTPHQPVVLTVIPDPPASLPTGRADRLPDHSHSTPTGLLRVMPAPPHTLSTDRAHRYAGPSSLPSNPPR